MTIKEAAVKYNVTVQAIYSRLKANNISVESLKEPGKSELSADGEAVLNKLYSSNEGEKPESYKSMCERLQARVYELEKNEAALLEKVNNLSSEIQALRKDKEQLAQIAQQAQELHKMAIERMLPAAPAAPTATPAAQVTPAAATGGQGLKRIFSFWKRGNSN